MEKEAHIRSIGRSLAVLRVVNQAGSMSMMQIANAVGVPYPTARRIVCTLQDEGMLERESLRKYYRPTALVQSLSHGYQDDSDLVDIARPELEGLTRRHFWPVSLTTRVGQHMIVRDCTHASSPMALTHYQPGATFPLLECASGHVMLAFEGNEERGRWLDAADRWDKTPDPHMSKLLRSEEFARTIRDNGYALRRYNQFTNTPGRTSSIAVPIFVDGHICATLTLIFFSVAMEQNLAISRYVPDLKAAANAISTRLAADRPAEFGPLHTDALHADVECANLRVA
jgi:IclR family mhp operon transcriptional activator